MDERKGTGAISQDVALRLCKEIRRDNQGKWYRWTAWWCWFCIKASQGDPAKMCFSNHAECRGCLQMNARNDRGQTREPSLQPGP
jgi:hypothetical protein